MHGVQLGEVGHRIQCSHISAATLVQPLSTEGCERMEEVPELVDIVCDLKEPLGQLISCSEMCMHHDHQPSLHPSLLTIADDRSYTVSTSVPY